MTTRIPPGESGAVEPRPPVDRLGLAVLCCALMPLAALLGRAVPPIDYWWDFSMALGAVATGGLALLPLLSARWWVGIHRSATLLRVVQRLHRDLAWWLTGFAALHVLAVLWLEPRTLDYLLPTAPGYMLAGLVALLVLLALVVTSLGRVKRRWPQASWRRWHAFMSITVLAGIGWHLLGAGYYFRDWVGAGVLGWALAVPSALALRWHCSPRLAPAAGAAPARGPVTRPRAALACAIALALLAAAAWLARPFLVDYASPRSYPCPVGRCL